MIFLCLISCATTLKIQVERPAKTDLNGAKTIAVLPFKPYKIKDSFDVFYFLTDAFIFDSERCDPDEKRCIEKLKYEIEDGLAKSPYITLINSAEVQKAIKNNYINPADVYLVGKVSYFFVDDVKHNVKRPVKHYVIDEEGNKKEVTEYECFFEFSRNVTFIFNYQIVNSADSKVLSNGSVELNNQSGHYNSKSELPSVYSLLQYNLSDAAKKILREIQPYTITKSIKLLKDKTKNPDMKNADKLAAEFYLQESYDEFLKIYNSTGLFEAGYNAAVLKEVMGDLYGAKKMLEELYSKTFDERALKCINDIENEFFLAERLKNQTETENENEFLDF